MKRALLLLICGGLVAAQAHANGIKGTVTKSTGGAVWPCTISIVNRQTGQPVTVPAESTLTSGAYNLVLPDGRYDVTFSPKAGSHTFPGFLQDQRVTANTITANLVLPFGHYVSGKIIGTDNVGVGTTDIRFKTPTGVLPNNTANNGTNADGTFTTIVDPGLWTVEIIPAQATHKVPAEVFNVDLTNQDVVLGNVVVQNGFILTCSATDASHFPVSNGSIIAREPVGHTRLFTPNNNTNGSGVVTLVLPPGAVDLYAVPPPGNTTLAPASAWNYNPAADATVPNFTMQPARAFSVHIVDPTNAPLFNTDIDLDTTPGPPYFRLETPNDHADVNGNVSVAVPSGFYRLTINPPVATKCLSFRRDSLTVGAAGLNLGTVTAPFGHWLDVTVLEQGTNAPIAGANIDMIDAITRKILVTIDDVTLANGATRIVVDNRKYDVRIAPPSTALYDTLHIIGDLRTLSDTAITVFMPRKVLAVGGTPRTRLEFASAWPNPARGGMSFAFAGEGEGVLDIVDVAGRRVATPWHGSIAGERTARWEGVDDAGRTVANGVYFARLRIGDASRVRRVVVSH